MTRMEKLAPHAVRNVGPDGAGRDLPAYIRIGLLAVLTCLVASASYAQPAPSLSAGTPEGLTDEETAVLRSEIPDEGVGHGPFTALVRTDAGYLAVPYMVVGEDAVAGGDMVVGTHQEMQAQTLANGGRLLGGLDAGALGGAFAAGAENARSALQPFAVLELQPFGWGTNNPVWPVRTIPYRIDGSIPEGERRRNIRTAIATWNSQAPVSLRLATELTSDQLRRSAVVVFRDNAAADNLFACSSGVGYGRGGRDIPRYVNLNPSCEPGHIMHEIGHRVGLHHEHQRTDRERLITVHRVPDADNYGELAGRNLSGHDLCSLMHYTRHTTRPPWFTLTREGADSHAACRRNLQDQSRGCTGVGQRCQLSPVDLRSLEQLYRGVPQ